MQKKTNQEHRLPVIGIDLMGSDTDASTIMHSILPVFEELQDLAHFVLFGKKDCAPPVSLPYISYVTASEAVEMDDHPLWAARNKKDSSLSLGIETLKLKKIDAFICMGNTGALVTTARTRLKTLPSITHPALLALLPTEKGEIAVLDVGANAEYKSAHLVEFAAMGIAYQKTRGIQNPTVALLNIGKEELKGPAELREAYKTLKTLSDKHSYPFFMGNIEAKNVFQGRCDVLVTGGFAGNVFLKTAEGVASFLLSQLPVDSSGLFKKRLDYRKYPGATLAGVSEIVIKCHGDAKSEALKESIVSALDLLEKNFLRKITTEISSFFSDSC